MSLVVCIDGRSRLADTPNRRKDAIRDLLERLPDLTEPGTGGTGIAGSGERLMLMPHDSRCHITDWNPPLCTCWRRSVVELERLLYRLQFENYPLFRQITLRYLRAERVTKDLRYLSGRWHGLAPNEAVSVVPGGWALALADQRQKRSNRALEARVTVARWSESVDSKRVDEALSWLSREWAASSEPMLPVVKAA